MDARSRMEARRKKILENSEARMSKILGRPYVSKETTDQTDRSRTAYMLSNGISNGSTSYFETNSNSTTEVQRLLGYLDVTNEEETRACVQLTTSSSEYINSLIFICLGLLARFSYLLGLSWLFSENLMLPFFLIGIPWTYLQSKDNVQVAGMIPTILLYCGLPQVNVIKLIKMMTFFRMLSQYFSLYLFCFIMLHCILDCTINT